MESARRTYGCEEEAISQSFSFLPLDKYYQLTTNNYSLEPFIRNTSAMDHWFLCIGQLLCTPKANGHSFTPLNCQWPGFTCLSVTGHQRLTFVFLSAIELEWLGSTSSQSVTFSTNTAFRNGFLPILCSLCRILGRLAGLVLSHAGNDLYFTFHCSHPVWVNHSRCGCHSKPEAEPCYHSVANQHTINEAQEKSLKKVI